MHQRSEVYVPWCCAVPWLQGGRGELRERAVYVMEGRQGIACFQTVSTSLPCKTVLVTLVMAVAYTSEVVPVVLNVQGEVLFVSQAIKVPKGTPRSCPCRNRRRRRGLK